MKLDVQKMAKWLDQTYFLTFNSTTTNRVQYDPEQSFEKF